MSYSGGSFFGGGSGIPGPAGPVGPPGPNITINPIRTSGADDTAKFQVTDSNGVNLFTCDTTDRQVVIIADPDKAGVFSVNANNDTPVFAVNTSSGYCTATTGLITADVQITSLTASTLLQSDASKNIVSSSVVVADIVSVSDPPLTSGFHIIASGANTIEDSSIVNEGSGILNINGDVIITPVSNGTAFEIKNAGGTAELTFTTSSTAGSNYLNLNNLTASTALVSDASKNIISSVTTATELSYVHGATSNIQAQINALTSSLTANTGVVTNSTPTFVSSAASATQVGYLSNVTSDIQTQINGKQASLSGLTSGDFIKATGSGTIGNSSTMSESGTTVTIGGNLLVKASNTNVFDIEDSSGHKFIQTDTTNYIQTIKPYTDGECFNIETAGGNSIFYVTTASPYTSSSVTALCPVSLPNLTASSLLATDPSSNITVISGLTNGDYLIASSTGASNAAILSESGTTLTMAGNMQFSADNTYSIGTTSNRAQNIYTENITGGNNNIAIGSTSHNTNINGAFSALNASSSSGNSIILQNTAGGGTFINAGYCIVQDYSNGGDTFTVRNSSSTDLFQISSNVPVINFNTPIVLNSTNAGGTTMPALTFFYHTGTTAAVNSSVTFTLPHSLTYSSVRWIETVVLGNSNAILQGSSNTGYLYTPSANSTNMTIFTGASASSVASSTYYMWFAMVGSAVSFQDIPLSEEKDGSSKDKAIPWNPVITYHEGPPEGMDITKDVGYILPDHSNRLQELEMKNSRLDEKNSRLDEKISKMEKLVESLLVEKNSTSRIRRNSILGSVALGFKEENRSSSGDSWSALSDPDESSP